LVWFGLVWFGLVWFGVLFLGLKPIPVWLAFLCDSRHLMVVLSRCRPGITITSPSKEKNEPQLAVGPAAKDTAPDGSAAGPGSGKVNSVGKN
jgi:hypothetical protein